MAFADYDQREIVAQIQGFFQLSRDTNPDFLKGTNLSSISGDMDDATRASVTAWLALPENQTLAANLNPNDPRYLEKLYDGVQNALYSSPALQERLRTLAEASAANVAQLDENAFLLYQEKQLWENRKLSIPAGADPAQYNAMVDPGLATATEQFRAAEDALALATFMTGDEQARRMLRAGNALAGFGGPVLATDADQEKIITASAAANLHGPQAKPMPARRDQLLAQQEPYTQPAAVVEAAPEVEPEPAVEERRPEPKPVVEQPPARPRVPPSEYSNWFIMNVVLNRGDYSIHTQRVWQDIREIESQIPLDQPIDRQKTAGTAIDAYLASYTSLGVAEFVRQYKERNEGKDPPQNELDAARQNLDGQLPGIRESLITQVARLREIEAGIQGLQPAPQQLANNFIEKRVIPQLAFEPSRDVLLNMIWKNRSMEDCLNDYFTMNPGKTDAEQAQIRAQVTADAAQVDRIRTSVTAYEGIQPTAADAVRIMRESWSKNPNLPNSADHYAQMLEQRIAHYGTPAGGSLDSLTAASRAMVDIRAQIDKDSGAPPGSIVDEKHSFYQNDIMTMGDWLRGKLYAEQQVAAGNAPTMTAAMRGIDEYGYMVHRRSNVEDTLMRVRTEQLTLSNDLLRGHGAVLEPQKEGYLRMGIDISSPEALAISLRNPQARDALMLSVNTLTDTRDITPEARDAIEKIVTQFAALDTGFTPRETAPAGSQPQITSAQVATQQVTLANEVLTAYGTYLTNPMVKSMLPAGIDVSSAAALAESLRNPAARANLANLAGMLPAATANDLTQKLNRFGELETQRLQLAEAEARPPVTQEVAVAPPVLVAMDAGKALDALKGPTDGQPFTFEWAMRAYTGNTNFTNDALRAQLGLEGQLDPNNAAQMEKLASAMWLSGNPGKTAADMPAGWNPQAVTTYIEAVRTNAATLSAENERYKISLDTLAGNGPVSVEQVLMRYEMTPRPGAEVAIGPGATGPDPAKATDMALVLTKAQDVQLDLGTREGYTTALLYMHAYATNANEVGTELPPELARFVTDKFGEPAPAAVVSIPDPEPTHSFGEDFHLSNPFRMMVELADLNNPQNTLVADQSTNMVNVFYALADGQQTLTLADAIQGFHQIHDEDFVLTDEKRAAIAAQAQTLASELGIESGQRLNAADPRLLQAVAAYANDRSTIANLPEQWKQAFTQASATVAAERGLKPDGLRSEFVTAGEATQPLERATPQITASFVADVEVAMTDVNMLYLDLQGANVYSPDEKGRTALNQMYDKFTPAQAAYNTGHQNYPVTVDDSKTILTTGYDYVIHGQHALQTMLDNPSAHSDQLDILTAMRDRFAEQAKLMEELAARNGVDLPERPGQTVPVASLTATRQFTASV